MARQVTEQHLFAGMRLATAIFLLLAWFAGALGSPAQDPPMHHDHEGHEGMSMPMDQPLDPAAQAKVLADKRESEFNHHLAGFFLILAGASIFFQGTLLKRWPAVKFVWPGCFLVAGIFLMIWSDTELWPFGHRQWLEALQNNREVLQHKTFAVLLLVLGAIEWQRTRGALRAAWSNWVFPAVAVTGSLLLIFHEHQGGMVGADHMKTMALIQSEHLTYLMCGFAIGLANGLGTLKTRAAALFNKVWPLLIMALGVLLMFYKE